MCDWEWLTFRNWLRPICVSPDQRWQQCLLIRQSCARHCIGQFTLLTAAYYLRQRDSIEAGSVLVLSKPAFAYQRIGGTMRRQASPLTAKTSSSFAQSLCERACSVRSRSVCVVGIFADQRHSLLDSCSIWTLLTARALANKTSETFWPNITKHVRWFWPNIRWHIWLATSFCRSTTWHHWLTVVPFHLHIAVKWQFDQTLRSAYSTHTYANMLSNATQRHHHPLSLAPQSVFDCCTVGSSISGIAFLKWGQSCYQQCCCQLTHSSPEYC